MNCHVHPWKLKKWKPLIGSRSAGRRFPFFTAQKFYKKFWPSYTGNAILVRRAFGARRGEIIGEITRLGKGRSSAILAYSKKWNLETVKGTLGDVAKAPSCMTRLLWNVFSWTVSRRCQLWSTEFLDRPKVFDRWRKRVVLITPQISNL